MRTNIWRLGFVAVLSSLLLVAAGCSDRTQPSLVEGKVNVVTSFYPIYFMVNEIGGEQVNAINLIPAGVEPHDWTPKSIDLHNASNAQLLLVNGAGFEGWLPDFKKGLDPNSKVKLEEVSKGITLITAEGDAHSHEHEHAHENEPGHAEESAKDEHHAETEHSHEHGDFDPHTWVSPKSALVMADNVKNALISVDSANKVTYEQRYEQLRKKIEAVDNKYEAALKNVKHRDIVVSHHAFGYLTHDYGLNQHAIMGITPDAEPRAQDILRLSKLVQEKGLKYVFFEELVSDQLAKTLASEANVDILVLNPLEGLTEQQQQAGDNYLKLMERNLQNLVQALQ
ncbi:zinc ABC transporter substrate-binding protein [Paenibacillus sp. 481]|nr:zinc ABC transporter substrate-binding protein [Paenibacillus sp. 481]UHA76202.1 zinc ABC transporter substrate-binding protein [Paenibacillus sp. 481]